MGALVVLVTASSQEEALLIGRGVVGKRLAACVTVVPKVTSILNGGARSAKNMNGCWS